MLLNSWNLSPSFSFFIPPCVQLSKKQIVALVDLFFHSYPGGVKVLARQNERICAAKLAEAQRTVDVQGPSNGS